MHQRNVRNPGSEFGQDFLRPRSHVRSVYLIVKGPVQRGGVKNPAGKAGPPLPIGNVGFFQGPTNAVVGCFPDGKISSGLN